MRSWTHTTLLSQMNANVELKKFQMKDLKFKIKRTPGVDRLGHRDTGCTFLPGDIVYPEIKYPTITNRMVVDAKEPPEVIMLGRREASRN